MNTITMIKGQNALSSKINELRGGEREISDYVDRLRDSKSKAELNQILSSYFDNMTKLLELIKDISDHIEEELQWKIL